MPKQVEDTQGSFLAELGNALSTQEGVDAELAEILKRNLLQAAPSDQCVDNARAAILKLAEERAASKLSNADE